MAFQIYVKTVGDSRYGQWDNKIYATRELGEKALSEVKINKYIKAKKLICVPNEKRYSDDKMIGFKRTKNKNQFKIGIGGW